MLTGVWEALVTGHADLAIGLTGDTGAHVGIEVRPLGEVPFVFAVAPHHPLVALPEPLPDEEIQRHRAVAVADSAQRLAPATHNLLGGQDVLTVTSMQAKIEAQVRCLGCGFIPEPLARTHIRTGVLVVRRVQRGAPRVRMSYAWRADAVGQRTRRHRAWRCSGGCANWTVVPRARPCLIATAIRRPTWTRRRAPLT